MHFPPPAALLLTGAVLLAAAGAAPAGAQTEVEPLLVVPGTTFELPVGGVARVEGTGTEVRFEGVVQDSRCPANVLCVWAGEAHLELLVREPGAEPRRVTVVVPGSPSGISLGRAGGPFELVSLSPAPAAGQPPRLYAVRLRIAENLP